MKTKKKWLFLPLTAVLILAVLAALYLAGPRLIPASWFGFAYEVPAEEAQAREALVDTACGWVGVREDDGYLPLPGDIIYYDWDLPRSIDCTGWPEHVGIVVGTYGPYIRVVEGNMDDGFAGYRTILRNDWCIRGYGLPDYASK